ncbi:DsbA family protein [Candidatus Peregrinibacteria bacterium]|nr:DsbA family protein [Candidatus Peregrinibacteria bacterium]
MPKGQQKVVATTLVLSIAALLLSAFTLYKISDAPLEEDQFMASVEKGIEAYIEKQRQLQEGPPTAGEPVDVSIDDDAMKGDKNAPVTIVEFSDFECPFCSRFYRDTLPDILSEYVDKGKVRFVYRDFALSFHQHARTASLASECAKDQGGDKAFFKYHDKLYENQTALSTENFKAWAVELGLNASKFNDCLDSEKFADEIDKDFADGKAYGVTGTPAFFINGRLVSGAQPFSVFKGIIDEELAK